MKTSLVIFDLDGTLLDTIGDLAVACNAVLGVRGLPQHTYEEYCHFVGNGILRLVERALPEPLRTPETVAAVRADFVKYYTEHIDAHTRPYDGIPELIAELARRGVALAVASNKFQAGTETLVGLFFPGVTFAAVLSFRPGKEANTRTKDVRPCSRVRMFAQNRTENRTESEPKLPATMRIPVLNRARVSSTPSRRVP